MPSNNHMFKIVFVITIVSFGIHLKTESSSKMRAHPRSLKGKPSSAALSKSTLGGSKIHKTSLKKTPQPRKLAGSIMDTLTTKFSSMVGKSFTNGNGDEVSIEDSVTSNITPKEILTDMPPLDVTKPDTKQAWADALSDHEIAKVEKIMARLGPSEETNPETMITIENVCDQEKMTTVDDWTADYFTQFYMESATSMHETGLNLKTFIFKHLARVETYRNTVLSYNLLVLKKFTLVYLTARVMLILKAAGGFIGVKVGFKSFMVDSVAASDKQVLAFIDELKKKMFRQDLIQTTFKDFKFRVETLQVGKMETYYQKHFTEKDGKNGLDKLDLMAVTRGRDEQIVGGVCGMVVTLIKLIMSDTPAQKKILDTYSSKTPVVMEYIKNFLQNFGRLFVPDLDDFGNPLKEKKEWSEGKEVGFFWQNCYSIDEKGQKGEKPSENPATTFTNVFSLLTFIIFGKNLNVAPNVFLGRNFFSRSYMLNVLETTGSDLLPIVQMDMFLLFTELKAEADFWDYFESAKTYKATFIFHIQFYNDFLVVPIEVGGKIALFSAAYGKSDIYPSFTALTKEVPDNKAKDEARRMYVILNNIYLIYSYMKLKDGPSLKGIPFDGDVKLVYHAIIKFMVNLKNIQAYYEAEEVKDKTIADCYLDVLTYLCYKAGTDCKEYGTPQINFAETIKIVTTTYNFKLTITILTTYQTIFKVHILISKANEQLIKTKEALDKLKLVKIHWKCRNLVDSTDALCKEHVELYKQWVVIFKALLSKEFIGFARRSFELILSYRHPTLGEETTRVFMIYILKYINEEKRNLAKTKLPEKEILVIIMRVLYPMIRAQYTTVLSKDIHYNFLFFMYRLFETPPKSQDFIRRFKILEEFEYIDLKMILYHVVLPRVYPPEKVPIRKGDERSLAGQIKNEKGIVVKRIPQEVFPHYMQMIYRIILNMKNKMNLEAPGAPAMQPKEVIEKWKAEFTLKPIPDNKPGDNKPKGEKELMEEIDAHIKWIEVYSKLTMYAQIFGFFDTFTGEDQKLVGLLNMPSQNFINVFYNYFIIASHSIASGVADIYDFQEFIYEKLNACMAASAEISPNVDMMAICHNLSHRKWAELYYFVKYIYVVINNALNISVLDYYSDKEPITNVRVFISIIQVLGITQPVLEYCNEDAKKIQVICMAIGILDIIKGHVQSSSQSTMSVEDLNDKIYDDFGQDKSPEGIKKLQTALLIASDVLKYYSEGKLETSRWESFFDYTRAETLLANSKNPRVKEFINKKHQFYDKKVYIMQANDNASKEFLASYLRRTFVKYVKDQNEEPIQMAVNKLLEAKPQVIEKFFITTNLPDFHYLKPILQYTNPNNYDKLAELMISNNIFLQIPSMNDPQSDYLWGPLIEFVGCTTYPTVAAYESARKADRITKKVFPCKYQTDKNGHAMYLKRLLEYISIKGRLDKLDTDTDIEEFNEDTTKSVIVKEEIASHDTVLHEMEETEKRASIVFEENKRSIDSMGKSQSMTQIQTKTESFVEKTVITEVKAKTPRRVVVEVLIEVEGDEENEAYIIEEEAKKLMAGRAQGTWKVINTESKTLGKKEIPDSVSMNSFHSSMLSEGKNQLTSVQKLQEETNIIDQEEHRLMSITKLDGTTKSFSGSFEANVKMHTYTRSNSMRLLQV